MLVKLLKKLNKWYKWCFVYSIKRAYDIKIPPPSSPINENYNCPLDYAAKIIADSSDYSPKAKLQRMLADGLNLSPKKKLLM
jgi:hypothetical protein